MCLISLAISALGCVGAADLPPIADPQAEIESVDASDVEVLGVAAVAALKGEYGRVDAEATARLVAPDRTARVCDGPESRVLAYGCIPSEDLEAIHGVVGDLFGEDVARVFVERNRAARRLPSNIGPITVAPSDVLFNLLGQRRWRYELPSAFPGKREVVVFGSPAYPVRRWAEVYVLHVASAASLVHLEHDGVGWEARAVRLLWIS